MSEKTHINVLERVMGILHQAGDAFFFFLQYESLFANSTAIQTILTSAYADLVQLTVGMMIHYKKTYNREYRDLLN